MRKKPQIYLEIDENKKIINSSKNIVSNSKRKKIKEDSKNYENKIKKLFKSKKWQIIFLVGIVLYFLYDKLIYFILNILKQNPIIYNNYLILESHINNNTILGMFLISILGALFFMVLPSEALFIYYLNSTNYYSFFIILIVILGCGFGLSFNYFFGKILGEKFLEILFKKNFIKYKNLIEKYGGYFLFFGNIFPGPIEVLAVFYGGFKFGYFKFLYLSIIGRIIKYTILFVAYSFFWDKIMLNYNIFIEFFKNII